MYETFDVGFAARYWPRLSSGNIYHALSQLHTKCCHFTYTIPVATNVSTFSSPNYSNHYEDHFDLTTKISVDVGVVVIQFNYFNIEEEFDCEFDVVEVRIS